MSFKRCQLPYITVGVAREMKAVVVDKIVLQFTELAPLEGGTMGEIRSRLDAVLGTDPARKKFLDRRGTLDTDQRTISKYATHRIWFDPVACPRCTCMCALLALARVGFSEEAEPDSQVCEEATSEVPKVGGQPWHSRACLHSACCGRAAGGDCSGSHLAPPGGLQCWQAAGRGGRVVRLLPVALQR
jgi:hypothetical protein